jgi:cytidine deaminase
MATSQHFLAIARDFQSNNDQLALGLYLESTLTQIQGQGSADAEDLRNGIDSLAQQLSKPLSHYTELLEAAKKQALETRQRAFAPFSNFLVGATLIAEDESFSIGCNVECSSYGLTICAERTALVSAVAHGKRRFLGVVVAADTDNLTPPCGACRQLLYDFAPDALVVLVNLQGTEKRFTMKELLPEAFSAAFLA